MKKTEIGMIPEDWVVGTFEDCLTGFSSGMTPYRAIKKYYQGDFPWITSGELNYNIISDTLEKISLEAIKKTNLKIIPKGTFLMAITGLEAAGTRGSCAITGIDATTNQSCMALYPIDNKITTTYLFHYYVRYGNELAFKYCQGTKQQSYNAVTAKKLPIFYPILLVEQEAIAGALSDADAWIESLEQLIAKKRLIKQGAMQELLTPKEGWEVKKVREIAKVGRGRVISHKEINGSQTKKYPVYSSQTTNNGIMGFIDTYDFDGEYVTWTTDGEKAGTVFHRMGKFNCTNVCGTIKLVKDNAKFISYTLGKITPKHVSRNLANPKLMNEPMKNIELPIPSLSEQERIATILSDMDAELEALEQQLHKVRQIKQGMMQELLTGRVRLNYDASDGL